MINNEYGGCAPTPLRALALAALAALALAAAPAAAKPVYMTVPRAFGTAESPTIDVAFQARGPVQLRVLKPEKLDAFLASQVNLRRAYAQPQIKDNPGRYLARGLNGVTFPGQFLDRALSAELRQELLPGLPDRPEKEPKAVVQLAEGPEKLIDAPAGMQVVRQVWLNLDLGGAGRDYNVPGFEEWGFGSEWEERKVALDPLPAGIYLVQLVQGKVEGQVTMVVTDLRVQVKQTDGEVLVRVAGKDGAPVKDAAIALRTPAGAGPTGKTDGKGEVRIASAEPRLLVLAQAGEDRALVDTDFYSTLAAAPDVFVYTDRPIYRPGDGVKFRGIVRQPDAFLSRLFRPKRQEVAVSLELAAGKTAAATAKVDEFGCFSGELQIPDDVPSGVVRVSAKLDDAPHGAEARVDEYVKPTFYLEVTGETESVRPGEVLKAKVRARRYAGGAPEDTHYEVYLYRSLLDGPAWVDDAGLGAQGSSVTYGTESTSEGKLSQPERLFSSVEARKEGYSEDPWANAPKFDEKGEAEIAIQVPALKAGDDRLPWRYSLSVRARDDQGTFANAARPYFLSPSDVMGLVRPGQTVIVAGGEASLAVRSTTLSGAVYPSAKGAVEFVLRKADGGESSISKASFTTGPDGVWRGTMPAPKAGTVLARVTLQDKAGHPWSGEGSLLVVGQKGEESVRVPALQIGSSGGVLAPAQEAELVALFPAGWGPGKKDGGKVWVTFSSGGLYDTRVLDVDGLSLVYRFTVERRYGSAVYASIAYPTNAGRWEERTVPFRIVPPERMLKVTVSPERPEAAPLGPQSLSVRVVDWQGRGVRAQLSLGVVDKAIYALQGEMRPRALDFFYPLVRNNVATFTSAEFQGYGYGEILARAFLAPGQAFAAVKPPTKVREVDTAYWNPSVVTDEDGRATVSFKLPSNQTIWTVTAVAADASGRFGETTAEFTARAGLQLVASVPLFLREGDQATGSVRLARNDKKKGTADFELSVAPQGDLGGTPVKQTVSVAPGAEQIIPVKLEGKQAGSGRVLLALTGGDKPLSDVRDLPVRPAAVEQVVTAAAFGGGRLQLDLPAGAKVEAVELSLRPSSVALALAQVEDLLTYPHGCLEQLVATTVPNVALHRVLESTGAVKDLDPAARALLAEARSRATQGIDRILALARPGGGFTWFSGYDETSVPLTLIALDGLEHAVDAGLLARDDPRLTESARWLEKLDDLPLAYDVTRAYVLARLDGARQAPRVRNLLEKIGDAPDGDLYAVAMAALAADKAGIAAEPAVKTKLVALTTRTREALVQPAVLKIDAQTYYAYPLRRAGLTAIVGHAASLGEVDVAVARRRLFEVLADPSALSTFERSTAILHSLWLVERDAKAMKDMPAPKVDAEGGAVPALEVRGAARWARLPVTVKAVKVAEFDGQAVLTARIRVPLASVKAAAEGMSVVRRYYKLLPGGEKKPIGAGDKVTQGEEVYVELTLDAHDGDQWRSLRSAYYVVEDAIPAGFVPLQEDKAYRAEPYNLSIAHEAMKRRSLSPERALFYFEEPAWWSQTPRVVGYVMRAQFPGRFSAPPATIEDMYAPKVHGRSEAAALEIVASGAK